MEPTNCWFGSTFSGSILVFGDVYSRNKTAKRNQRCLQKRQLCPHKTPGPVFNHPPHPHHSKATTTQTLPFSPTKKWCDTNASPLPSILLSGMSGAKQAEYFFLRARWKALLLGASQEMILPPLNIFLLVIIPMFAIPETNSESPQAS